VKFLGGLAVAGRSAACRFVVIYQLFKKLNLLSVTTMSASAGP